MCIVHTNTHARIPSIWGNRFEFARNLMVDVGTKVVDLLTNGRIKLKLMYLFLDVTRWVGVLLPQPLCMHVFLWLLNRHNDTGER